MPQSSKDSNGGKTHASKSSGSGGSPKSKAEDKKSNKSANSPTGPHKHGEKKTTN